MTDQKPKPFLERVARDLLAKQGERLSDMEVVLPSRRACHYFKRYLAMVHPGPMLSPKIMAMDDFVRSKAEVELPGKVDLVLALYDCFQQAQAPEEMSLERFAPLGVAMLSDFNLIDRNLTKTETVSFFAYLEEVKAIERWGEELGKEIELDDDHKAKDYLRFWKALTKAYWLLREQLLDKGQAYSGMAYRLLLDSLDSAMTEGKVSQTAFIGFNMLTATEQELISQLQQNGLATSYWDMDSYYVDDPMQEAGMFFRDYQRKWLTGNTTFVSDHLTAHPKSILLYQSDSYTGQAQVAANTIREILSPMSDNERMEFQKKTNQIAILLPDEAMLQPMLMAMPDDIGLDWAKSLNITMGLSISQSQVHVLLGQLFDLQQSIVVKNEEVLVYHHHITEILHHSFVLDYDSQSITAKIRKNNHVYLNHSDLLELGLSEDFVSAFVKPWGTDVNLAIEGMLNVAKWLVTEREDRLPSVEMEFIASWAKLLRRLADRFSRVPDVSIDTFRHFLSELIRHESVPFAGEPIAPVQIMGMLESRALDFEHVIILSCNEKILPKEKNTESVVPFDLRQMFGMYTYREEDAVSAYTFYRLFHFAKTIHLISAPSNDSVGEPSRFVKQIEEEYARLPHVTLSHRSVSPSLPTSAAPPTGIEKTEWVLHKLEEKLANGISPSSFNRFLGHPKSFFLESVLKLDEADEVEEEMDARLFGDLLHETLDMLLQPYKGATLTPAIAQKIKADQKLIEQCMQNAAAKTMGKIVLDHGKNYILKEVAKQLIRRFMDQQTQEGSSAILDLETFYNSTISVTLDDGRVIQCKVAGKADRIDLSDGTIRVVDYKTGKVESGELSADEASSILIDGGKGKIVQLLLYKYLLIKSLDSDKGQYPSDWEDTTIVSGFYFFRKLSDGFTKYKLADEPQNHEDFKVYVEEMVCRMVREMFSSASTFGQEGAFETQ